MVSNAVDTVLFACPAPVQGIVLRLLDSALKMPGVAAQIDAGPVQHEILPIRPEFPESKPLAHTVQNRSIFRQMHVHIVQMGILYIPQNRILPAFLQFDQAFPVGSTGDLLNLILPVIYGDLH